MELPAEFVSLDTVHNTEIADWFKAGDLIKKERMEILEKIQKRRQQIVDHIKTSGSLPTHKSMAKYDISWEQIARLAYSSVRNRDPTIPIKHSAPNYIKKKDRDPEKVYKNYSKYQKKVKTSGEPHFENILEA